MGRSIDPPSGVPDGRPTEGTRRGGALWGLVLDIGLPLAGFYVLHALGASDWAALLTATAAAGVRLVATALWNRRVSWFAAVMLGVFGVGLALAFVDGEPRFLLLKDSVTTATIGAVFLVSLFGEHPLTLAGAQAWQPHRAEALAALHRAEPAARRAFRVSALGWGLALVGESALRVPLIYLLPLDVAVGASTALMITVMCAIAVWNVVYMTRAARRDPALAILLPGHGRGSRTPAAMPPGTGRRPS